MLIFNHRKSCACAACGFDVFIRGAGDQGCPPSVRCGAFADARSWWNLMTKRATMRHAQWKLDELAAALWRWSARILLSSHFKIFTIWVFEGFLSHIGSQNHGFHWNGILLDDLVVPSYPYDFRNLYLVGGVLRGMVWSTHIANELHHQLHDWLVDSNIGLIFYGFSGFPMGFPLVSGPDFGGQKNSAFGVLRWKQLERLHPTDAGIGTGKLHTAVRRGASIPRGETPLKPYKVMGISWDYHWNIMGISWDIQKGYFSWKKIHWSGYLTKRKSLPWLGNPQTKWLFQWWKIHT